MEFRGCIPLLLFGILGAALMETRATPDTIQEIKDDLSQLGIKQTATLETLSSVVSSLHAIQEAILKMISSSEENLKAYINERLTGFESNITEKMRTLENSVTNIKNNCASSSSVSRLNEYLQNLDKFTKTELHSIKSEVLPSVKQLEEKSDVKEDALEINTTLTIQSSEITTLNPQLLDVQSLFDETLTLQNSFGKRTITCYSDDNYENLQFSLALDTGLGAQMPTSVNYTKNPEGKYARIHANDPGVYECKSQGSTKIFTVRPGSNDDIYTRNMYKVASIGEDVDLPAEIRNWRNEMEMRWKHNGADVRAWDRKTPVTIPNVTLADAGIYECFYEGRRDEQHAIMRLIVRKCSENFYGKDCDRRCPRCYNGGVCHEEWGVCICPAGFTGTNCEVACGKGRFGANCTKSCEGRRGTKDCRYEVFCKPDPLGCACAPGYFSHTCSEKCNSGWYGADCKQPCHCKKGTCNIFTGACSVAGCARGWTGDSCQIKDYFDESFTLQSHMGTNKITCYSDDNYENIQFSLTFDTGKGVQMPTSVNYTKSPEEKYARIEVKDPGVYQCKSQLSMKLVAVRTGSINDKYTLNVYKVASIGDDVTLSTAMRNPLNLPVRWKHNGADVRDWDEKLDVTILNVTLGDAGIYECFYEERRDANHAIMRLIIRKCSKNFYGKDCDRRCPPCINGGECHEEWGVCICPAGFTGTNCEVACGEARFGVNCTKSCEGRRGETNCRFQYFCKPDPLGCTCAPGHFGHGCTATCDSGWYGADCKQPCHCDEGTCDIFTGACSVGGCAPGWTGDSCQIKDQFDGTLTLQNFQGTRALTCYSDDNYENLQFSLAFDTGKGTQMPASVNYTKNPEGKYARIDFQDPGVYQCKSQFSVKALAVRQGSDSRDMSALNPYTVASVGDAVELEAGINMQIKLPIIWKHNGVDVPSWDEKSYVTIPNVKLADAGIYECFYEGRWEAPHAIFRLFVKKCKENFYGKDCERRCGPCYNGGVCHEEWGHCICPEGFTGTNCEVACGSGRFGVNCTKSCEERRGIVGCQGQLFCKPDPVGCACAPGYFGPRCYDICTRGFYGADCKQPCHCYREALFCDMFTGACSIGCSPGWTGDSCQIRIPLDASFTLQNAHGAITCYSDDNYETLEISLAHDTGKGNRLPTSVNYTTNPEEKYARVHVVDPGVYACKSEADIKIFTMRQGSNDDTYTLNMYKVATIGDDVELSAVIRNSKDLPIRWRYNGYGFQYWNGKLNVTIRNVNLDNAGIYECFYEGRRDAPHAIMRLIVRKCKEGYYGKKCGELCTPCYNGGVCHDEWGDCICPAGFTGTNCEVACGEGRFGANCTKSCETIGGKEDCRFQFFCKPDPFGCACAPGYFGHTCSESCDPGWYGADCKQPCHCKVGTCNRFTGACSMGECSPGWTGDSCQIKGRN